MVKNKQTFFVSYVFRGEDYRITVEAESREDCYDMLDWSLDQDAEIFEVVSEDDCYQG